jgi:hypothetical protein
MNVSNEGVGELVTRADSAPKGFLTSPFLAGRMFDQPGFRGFGFSKTELLAPLIQTILALEQQNAS